jgi:hypothetical protein
VVLRIQNIYSGAKLRPFASPARLLTMRNNRVGRTSFRAGMGKQRLPRPWAGLYLVSVTDMSWVTSGAYPRRAMIVGILGVGLWFLALNHRATGAGPVEAEKRIRNRNYSDPSLCRRHYALQPRVREALRATLGSKAEHLLPRRGCAHII